MWNHLLELYKKCARAKTSTPGLTLLSRLKYEHVYPTSFSKMRVDLAAQVSFYCGTLYSIVIYEPQYYRF